MKTQQGIEESRDRQAEAKVLRLSSTSTEQYASKEEGLKWLDEVGTFAQGSMDWKRI